MISGRATIGLLAVITAAACTSGPSHSPSGPSPARTASAPGTASITVTPARHVQAGQLVRVAVTGFPDGGKVWLSECADKAAANPIGCGAQLPRQPFLVTDNRGIGSRTFRLRLLAADRSLRRPNVPCRYTCVLVATAGAIPDPVVAVAPLRYGAPASTTGTARLRVRPATGLRDREHIRLDLTRFLPGEKVYFSECAPGQHPTPLVGCADQAAAEPFTVTDDSGTRRGVTFRVASRVRGHPCRPFCAIAAVDGESLAVARIHFGVN